MIIDCFPEEQPVLDIKLPGRRRRASDDGDDTGGTAGDDADVSKLAAADHADESDTFEDAADTHHDTESLDGGADRGAGLEEAPVSSASDGEDATEEDGPEDGECASCDRILSHS